MPTLAACPSVEELQQFLLGGLPENQSGNFEAHLEKCEPCLKAMETLRPHDTLVQAVMGQSSITEDTGISSAIIDRVLQQVTLGEAARGESRPDATAGSDSEELSLDFLATPQQPDEVGRLDGYRVLKVLGAGGMGVVFQAEDIHLKRRVALKVMKPEAAGKPAARERFLREGQAAAALEHEHVVTIYQVGEANGVPFLAMQWLKGMTLDERLKESAVLGIPEVLHLGRQIARGLAAAHDCGLVHRDIKPSNLWLETSAGEPGTSATGARIKILDFGLARALSEEVHLTQSGAIVGTPAYMAPEQARGKKVDRRCDLFSLGVVLYRMATGQLPFRGDNTMAVLTSLAVDTPTAPQLINFAVPSALSDLIMQLLAKDPAGRPASAAEVANRLEAIERESTAVLDSLFADLAGSTGPVRPQPRPARALAPARQRRTPRRRILAIAAGFLALITLAAVVIYWETRDGTIRIEINDPAIEVTFDETGPTIKGAEKDSIKLKPGDHGIHVKRGDFEFDTDKFVLKKGETISLKVELRPGKIQVTQGDKTIGQKELQPASDPDRMAAEWVLSIDGKVSIDADGDRKDVAAAKDLPAGAFRLAKVDLQGNQHVTDPGLVQLKALASLTTLDLSNTRVADAGLDDLARFAKLVELNLLSTRISSKGFAILKAALPGVRIRWSEPNRTAAEAVLAVGGRVQLRHKNQVVKKTSELPAEYFRVTRVSLAGVKIAQADLLPKLAALTDPDFDAFRALDLSDSIAGNTDVPNLNRLTSLEELVLARTKIDDLGLVDLKLPQLKKLSLAGSHITDAGLKGLEKLTELKELDLTGTKVTKEGVTALQKALPKCKIVWDGSEGPDRKTAERNRASAVLVLTLGGNVHMRVKGDTEDRLVDKEMKLPEEDFQITRISLHAGIAAGPGLWPNLIEASQSGALRSLDLADSITGNVDIGSINLLTSLEELSLARARNVDDLGIVELNGLKKLRKLSLAGCNITDTGVKNLEKLTDLKELDRTGTKVTKEGVAALEKKVPKCKIVSGP